jgi:N-acyl-L-homoserine lactone synthetase
MIIAFTQVSAHQYPDIIRSTHALRYRAFVQRMGWSVPRWNDMEYDQYDNLSTVYLVWRDPKGAVRGTCRLAPTDRPYMLKDLWPHIVTTIPLPDSPYVFEASRFCIDHHLPAELRRQIISELVCAYQQIGLLNDLDYLIGVMPPNIWQHVFGKSGWEIEFIGPETILDTGEVIVAGKMNLSPAILDSILRATGLKEPPLLLTPEVRMIVGDAVLSEDLHKESV